MGYSDYYYDIYEGGYELGEAIGSGVASFIGLYLIILLFSLAIGLVFYLLEAVGLYKMGKTVGASAPWLSFIPVLNVFALGRVAETPTGAKKPMKYGLILLLLNIANGLFSVTMVLNFINRLVTVINNFDSINPLEMFGYLTGGGSYAISSLLSIAYTVFYYIALYKIYKAFARDNAVLYLVLSIFFGIATPIIIFCLRNKPVQMDPLMGQVPPYGAYGYGQQNYYNNGNAYGQGNYYPPNGGAGQTYQQPQAGWQQPPQQPYQPPQPPQTELPPFTPPQMPPEGQVQTPPTQNEENNNFN
ncbi:MAG: hypothetical protein E7671_03185 [Ruminococcaceae bacterium]|nr:hypothetical protein [Oscillospiraceae bacterium]